MAQEIDPKICEFIDRYIDSVEQLELLLLLRQSAPRQWKAAEINEKVQSHLASVQDRLNGLSKMKLIQCGNELYSYPGEDRYFDQTIAELAFVYSRMRIRVIELIFSRPKNKLRDFSEAFNIRKDLQDG